jgi:hypothetical protein
MKARWRLDPVSRHRSYLVLTWLPAASRRGARVAVIGDVWDQPRTLALEFMPARELDATACTEAHTVVCGVLEAIVPNLIGPDPWAVALMTQLTFAPLEAEIVWSPFDLSPEGQRRLRARFAAHERWRRAAR